MLELVNNTKDSIAVGFGTYKSTVDPTSNVIDRQGFESVMLLLHTGTVTDGQTLAIVESDVSGSGYTAVDVGDLVLPVSTVNTMGPYPTQFDSTHPEVTQRTTAAFFLTMTATTDNNTLKKIGYKGTKRYIKVTCTGAGSTGAGFGVIAVLGRAHTAPVL